MNLTQSLTGWTTTCPTCDGDGRELDDVSAAALAKAIEVEAVVNEPCPDCDGRGWILDPDRLEAATATLVPSDTTPSNTAEKWMPYFRDKAEAALLAYLEPPT